MFRTPLERAGLTEPAKSSPYRQYFDDARHPADALSVSLSALFHAHRKRLDNQLQAKSRYVPITPDMVIDIGSNRSRDLSWRARCADDVMDTICDANYQNKTRVRMHNIFSAQLLFLPLLFQFPADNVAAADHRERLVEGIYGKVTEYTSFLLNKLAEEDGSGEHTRNIIGALGEVVALGIGNRAQSAQRCFLPALHLADMQGIDIDHLAYSEETTTVRYTGIQVKAYNVAIEEKLDQPPGTCILDSFDLSFSKNCPPFHKRKQRLSAHAMALDANGGGATPLGHHNLSAEAGLDLIEKNITKIALDHSIEYPATFAK